MGFVGGCGEAQGAVNTLVRMVLVVQSRARSALDMF